MPIIARHPDAGPTGRPRRLRRVSPIPTLITLGNLVCGFAAIYFTVRALYDAGAGVDPSQVRTLGNSALERMLPSFLSVAAGLIVLGMVFDLFDGLIARVTRSTTNFGGQLDSLADMVTSGVAPALLILAFMLKAMRGESHLPSPLSESAFGRFAWVSAAVYVACAAIRLARFNVEHAEPGFDHRVFRGLPTPGAAALMVGLIIYLEQAVLSPNAPTVLAASTLRAMVYALPLFALITGLLMVSRLPYRKLVQSLQRKRPFPQLVMVLFLFAIFWSHKALTFLALTAAYALSGPVTAGLRYLRRERVRQRPGKPEATEPEQRVG